VDPKAPTGVGSHPDDEFEDKYDSGQSEMGPSEFHSDMNGFVYDLGDGRSTKI